MATVRIELADVPGLLRNYLDRCRSTNYKMNFPWIDHITEVKDAGLHHSLDEYLLGMVHRGDLETCWLAVPEIVDWNRIHGFLYGNGRRDVDDGQHYR